MAFAFFAAFIETSRFLMSFSASKILKTSMPFLAERSTNFFTTSSA